MKLEDSKSISVGDIYYVQSRYDCKSCFKVQVVEVIDDETVLVKGGYRQHHK